MFLILRINTYVNKINTTHGQRHFKYYESKLYNHMSTFLKQTRENTPTHLLKLAISIWIKSKGTEFFHNLITPNQT